MYFDIYRNKTFILKRIHDLLIISIYLAETEGETFASVESESESLTTTRGSITSNNQINTENPTHITTARQTPPLPTKRTTTPISRVSNTVSIAVPVALFGATIVIGYGLIIYAVISGGHRIPCLTPTS